MRVVHVDVAVVPERLDDFLEATRRNARASREEPGVLRFDVVQDRDDPTHVVLVEVYADEDAPAAHKQTDHYAAWRDAVAGWMARPRTSTTFTPIDPDAEHAWRTGTP